MRSAMMYQHTMLTRDMMKLRGFCLSVTLSPIYKALDQLSRLVKYVAFCQFPADSLLSSMT